MSKKKKKKRHQKQDNIKSCTIFVDGMHCASCEVLIEKKLLQQEGVEAVDASMNGNRVEVNYTGNNRPDVKDLNEEFEKLGYEFSTKKFIKDYSPLFQVKNGELTVNKEKFKSAWKNVVTVVLLLVAFFAFEKLKLGQYVSVDSNSSLPAFVLLGVVAGLSSCAALVGGLLLSMTKQWNELYITSESKVEKAQPHIMFHIGRLVSFMLLGGVLGLLGETVSLNNSVTFAILTVVISLVMFILAMQMLEVEWAQKFKFAAPKFMTRFAADETNFKGKYMSAITGALTFFLPCGFTLLAQTVALTSGDALRGGMIMFAFALGTLPTLVGISLSGLAFNSKPHLTAKFNKVAGMVIVFFVIYNINGQLNVLGMPSLSDVSLESFKREEVTLEYAPIDADGIQVLSLTAEGFSYIPTGPMVLKAGVPARMEVDNQGIQGCGTFISARGLFTNYVSLDSGLNTVDLGNPVAGVYKLTCSMGMVAPVTVQVI